MQVFRGGFGVLRTLGTGLLLGVALLTTYALAADPAPRSRSSSAKDASQESVKIEPYTGPPIFLEGADQVVKPTIVTHETLREQYDDAGKTLRVEREVARYSDNNFAADGKYREFHPNGKPFIEGSFKSGRQAGEWTYYFDNGQVNRKATYTDGKPDGSWEIFRADGTLAAKARIQRRRTRRRVDHLRCDRQAAACRGALQQRCGRRRLEVMVPEWPAQTTGLVQRRQTRWTERRVGRQGSEADRSGIRR